MEDPRQTWSTPQWLFEMLDRQYRFTVDAAASAHNAKCGKFWTIEDNGLTRSWKDERVFCNPPWQNVQPWIAKASQESAELAVLLLPSRTDQQWFSIYAPLCKIEFISPGRVQFEPPPGVAASSAREGALLAIFGEGGAGTMGIFTPSPLKDRAKPHSETSPQVSRATCEAPQDDGAPRAQ